MNPYNWRVWKNNRIVGYVVAYSEREAYDKARKYFVWGFYVERMPQNSVSA